MPTAKSKPNPAPAAKRPRDLLRPTTHPIHPFDQIHSTDTSGLVPAAHLLTGHPNDEHVTAYYGVAPSILPTPPWTPQQITPTGRRILGLDGNPNLVQIR